MSGVLALAASIAAMDRAGIARLVAARPPQSVAGVHDPIGLAVELLRPESVASAIELLPRSSIEVLLGIAGETAEGGAANETDEGRATGEDDRVRSLVQIGLLGTEGGAPVALPEVTAALRAGMDAAGVAVNAASTPPQSPQANGSSREDRTDWYGAALTATQRAAAILRALRARPERLNRRGTVSIATVRALAELTQASAESTEQLLRVLAGAGLTTHAAHPDSEHRQLVPTARAAAWAAEPHPRRWLELAESHLRSISSPLESALQESAGDLRLAAHEVLAAEFPLLPAAAHQAARSFAATAEDLGLTVGGVLSPPAQALLTGGAHDADADALGIAERDMPSAVTGVYVQPDLSIVVPGPLAPADEEALLALADTEQLGIASTMRITVASVSRAFESGWNVERIEALLDRLSLTGIPQPLAYLLSDTAQRAGSIVVHEHNGDEGRTRISVARPELLDALRIDRSLAALRLTRGTYAGESVLFSRLAAGHALTSLGDARYPARSAHSAPSSSGASVSGAPAQVRDPGATTLRGEVSRGTSGPTGGDPSAALSPALTELVDRVHCAAATGDGDVTRKLELAIRDRSVVMVTAEARGRNYTFSLLPISLNAGRLRAADQSAGVERTLPISAITAVDIA